MKAPRRVNAGGSRRGRGRKGRAARSGDQRWIYGYHAIERRLRVDPASLRSILLDGHPSQRRTALAELAAACGVATREVDEAELQRCCGSSAHQGVAAIAAPFAYGELDDVLASQGAVLVLDQINDPHNLGALLRTAVAAGFTAAVLPQRAAVGITGAVEKAAAGAVNDIAVCRVTNLVRALESMAAAGYWRVGLEASAPADLFSTEMPEPVALVLGGESGIRRLVRESCDLLAAIPQRGPIESLNASVAGAIAMYEVLRQAESR